MLAWRIHLFLLVVQVIMGPLWAKYATQACFSGGRDPRAPKAQLAYNFGVTAGAQTTRLARRGAPPGRNSFRPGIFGGPLVAFFFVLASLGGPAGGASQTKKEAELYGSLTFGPRMLR